MQENGQGDVADSWVGRGQNKQINPRDLEQALGRDKMKSLAEQAGLSDVQFMQGLAQGLPQVIDRMTPDGRLPTRDEAERVGLILRRLTIRSSLRVAGGGEVISRLSS